MARRRFVQVDGELVEVTAAGNPAPGAGFYVIPDSKPYRSMVTGEEIGGRRQHREHLKMHDLVEVGNDFRGPKKMPDVPGRKEAILDAYRRAVKR